MKTRLLLLAIILLSIHGFGQVSLPYFLDFENATFPPAGCQLVPSGSPAWERNTSASGYDVGTASLSFDNFNTVSGSYSFRLPSMNFTGIPKGYIRFDVAYAEKNVGVSDNLALSFSNNGTTNWQVLQNYSGNLLATSLATTAPFVPVLNDWRTTLYPLQFVANMPYVMLAFQDDCANGNFLYLDNIIIFDSAAVGIENMDFDNGIYLYPNPVVNELNIRFKNIPSLYSIEVSDILGNHIISKQLQGKNNSIDVSELAKGVYVYMIFSENKKIKTGKFIRQ
jgi:hypothetical protein